MALKRLAAFDLAATTETLAYTVPSSKEAFLAVNLVNRSTENRTVRIALTVAATPTDADWIEYGLELASGEALLREGLTLEATGRVYVWASGLDVAAVLYGNEGDA
jgi:hypothetical protein